MADLPIAGVEKKEVGLTTEQRVDLLAKDVQELARGVNTQARLLEAIVFASDHIVKIYLELTRKPDESKEENPKV